MFLSTLSPSVPSVPQGVSARRTGSTTVLVIWMEPAVSFREHTTTALCLLVQYGTYSPLTIILSAL